jgi:hypothetical protein
MTISDVCEFKLNFQDADFWLIRKGSEKTVGTPVKEFSPEHIGVKIINTDLVLPDFLFYYFQFLHMQGLFIQYAHGTLNLKNIKISDIKNIPIAFK